MVFWEIMWSRDCVRTTDEFLNRSLRFLTVSSLKPIRISLSKAFAMFFLESRSGASLSSNLVVGNSVYLCGDSG